MRFREEQTFETKEEDKITLTEILRGETLQMCDEYGVKVFTSPSRHYLGNHKDYAYPSSCLLTCAGQLLVHQHLGILSAVDLALQILDGNNQDTYEATLREGSHLSLRLFGERYWHTLYLLTINNKLKFIIKTRNLDHADTHYDMWQPYNHQLLQSIQIANQFKDEMRRANILLLRHVFTSPHVCISCYEEGSHPEELTIEQIECLTSMNEWVRNKRKSSEPLWHKVWLDVFENTRYGKIQSTNLIQRPDDSIVIIDPFVYRFSNVII